MPPSSLRLTVLASVLLGSLSLACGGKTDDPGGTSSSSGSSSGGSSGSSSGSTTGSSSGSVSGSSSGTTVTATCAGVCMAIYALPCGQGQPEQACEMSCLSAESMAMTKCPSQWTAFLDCTAQPGALACVSGMAQATACVPEETALANCENPPPPPPPGCESIPLPSPVGLTCSGSAGPGGPTTYTCNDGSGNTWVATCQGSSCSCQYDGKMICTCATSGGSCCPGTQ